MADLLISEVLDKAADLIEPAGAWGRVLYATNNQGVSVDAIDPSACRFCAMGAVYRAADVSSFKGVLSVRPARVLLAAVVGGSIARWNDAPERTQAEVVSKLREAAALARKEGK